ncbi:SLOG family protein [Oscillospiraceae bacterium 21-37]
MNRIQKGKLRGRTCCFTGHRNIPPEEVEGIQQKLETTILELYNQGVIYYGAGGALGFDALAAEAVLHLRDNGCPNLRLILVLPCPDQTRGWKAENIARYEEIKGRADKIVYTSQAYTPGCMHRRNRHLVDNSSVCVCYLTQCRGGTAYTAG